MKLNNVVRVGVVLGVLGMVTGGCGGMGDHKAALAPTLAPIPETVALKGTWRGVFTQVGAGDTGQVQGNIVVSMGDDGTYSGTWTTQVVAGSSRGSRIETAGELRPRAARSRSRNRQDTLLLSGTCATSSMA